MPRMDSIESLCILTTSYKHSSQHNKYLGSSFTLHSYKYNNIDRAILANSFILKRATGSDITQVVM